MKQRVRVHIRWMMRSFEYTWTEEEFLRCLRRRNCIGMVAEHGEKVVGFMIYELHKNKLHILHFAVHPSWRRQCVGQQMVLKLVSKLTSHRRTRITLHVRESNLPAQLFFKRQGFHAVRVLRGFYDDSREDAYVLVYRYGDEDDCDGFEGVNRITEYEEM